MLLWILAALSAFPFASLTEISMPQSPLLIAENNNTELRCNYTSEKQELYSFRVSLLKGSSKVEVCSIYWNKTHQSSKDNEKFSCQVSVNKSEDEVLFNLQKLHDNQTDLYICKIERISPAPYEHHESHWILILVNGLVNASAPECYRPQGPREYSMVMTIAMGVLAVYGMLITVSSFYCWLKKKKSRMIRNDYFNMTQWQSNDLKKRHPQPVVLARDYTAYRSWEP